MSQISDWSWADQVLHSPTALAARCSTLSLLVPMFIEPAERQCADSRFRQADNPRTVTQKANRFQITGPNLGSVICPNLKGERSTFERGVSK